MICPLPCQRPCKAAGIELPSTGRPMATVPSTMASRRNLCLEFVIVDLLLQCASRRFHGACGLLPLGVTMVTRAHRPRPDLGQCANDIEALFGSPAPSRGRFS